MTSQTGDKLIRSLQTELATYQGKNVFFERLEGNNGDKLIEMGGLEILKKLGVRLVSVPEQAEAIVINGGAGMTDIWSHGFSKLKGYNSLYPKTPLFILPSSFSFTKTDFSSLFEDRVAPAFVYARERYSLKLLEELGFSTDVRLGIDHDLAFQLQNTPYLQKLKANQSQKHILIVERNDPESVTDIYKPRKAQGIKKHIPWSVKRPINKHLLWPLKRTLKYRSVPKMGAQSVFAQECYQKVLEAHPEFVSLPLYAADISDPALCSFARFNQLIKDAAVVVSTRLHVGILAAMLDKPTYLKSGSYHKIRGIYEYSLEGKSNVKLLS